MKTIINVHGRSSTVIHGEKRWAKNDKGESLSALNGYGNGTTGIKISTVYLTILHPLKLLFQLAFHKKDSFVDYIC